MRKDFDYYSQFGWTENPERPYVWHDKEKLWYEQQVGTGEDLFMSGITLKDVLEKLENAIELEDWTIVQELLNDIEMELEYANPFDQYEDEEDLH